MKMQALLIKLSRKFSANDVPFCLTLLVSVILNFLFFSEICNTKIKNISDEIIIINLRYGPRCKTIARLSYNSGQRLNYLEAS